MSLDEIQIKNEYRSLLDNIPQDFYIPLLKEAVSYKRAVGFFSSSSLAQIAVGMVDLAERQGKIDLIVSPHLSDEDIEAIKQGYQDRDKIIQTSLLRELLEADTEDDRKRLNLLAHLIADGVLDIKVAFTENHTGIGMYHEKVGIIEDQYGNKVVFTGSMNESATAMISNYETIDVFCSWKEWETERVSTKVAAFSRIWENTEPWMIVKKFPEVDEQLIRRYKIKSYYDKDLDAGVGELAPPYGSSKKNIPRLPAGLKLHDYQEAAIKEWANQGYRGIFDMATGTGKTYTGLAALTSLTAHLHNKLAVIIVCPFQHLVEQWVEDLEKFNITPIIGYSASRQSDWRNRLKRAIVDQRLGVPDAHFFCFICTNATFSSDYVQSQIGKIKGKKLLLVDEAHNFGAQYLSKLLLDGYEYRLALSATLERHGDVEGTASLFNFFGEKSIEYSLEQAIKEGKLCEYKYYPIVVPLTDRERQAYLDLTAEIGKCIIKDRQGKTRLNERGKILALERARVVAGANNKVDKLREAIEGFVGQSHMLVYCGAAKELQEYQDTTDIDAEDRRQIEVVTEMLGNRLKMKVAQFTSRENIKTREVLKEKFEKGEELDVLIAIKCLDEGVNIPNIQKAFILASTSNPKEYIQRRGRVLRTSPNKKFAEIYDFITITRPLDELPHITEFELNREKGLARREMARAREFSRLALNAVSSEIALAEIEDKYRLDDIGFDEWEE